jgi:predicted transcriptional regulator
MTISVRLEDSLVDQLDKLASVRRITRSDLLREQAERLVAEQAKESPADLIATMKAGPKPRYTSRELMQLTRSLA